MAIKKKAMYTYKVLHFDAAMDELERAEMTVEVGEL